MVKNKVVYYCEKCGKWRGSSKQCPECKSKTIERELPKARGDYYFIPGIDKPLPRVTSILKVLDKPGLSYWKAKTAAETALADPTLSVSEAVASIYQKRDKAGVKGSEIHKIISAMNKMAEELSFDCDTCEYMDVCQDVGALRSMRNSIKGKSIAF